MRRLSVVIVGVLLLLIATSVRSALAHPGGLDSNGGHHDRRNGTYHYHRGGPTILRTAPRVEPRKRFNNAPRVDFRVTAPSVPIVQERHDEKVVGSDFNDESLKYELIDKRSDGIRQLFRVRLLPKGDYVPVESDLVRIAGALDGTRPLIAMYYFAEMDPKRNAWATFAIDRDSLPRVQFFPSRDPKNRRPPE